MANHNLPTISSLYTEYTQSLKDRHDDALRQLDPAYTAPTNVPENAVRFSSAAGKWQRWDGTNWVDLAPSYAINVSGNAATATKLATARTIGGVSFDGSANINLPGVNATGNQNTTGNAATATTAATCTGNAATATDASLMLTSDDRIKTPVDDPTYRMRFGFTAWNNNGAAPWADYLHLRSYTDATGGNDNLVMFKKDGIGLRIWQQTFGSQTAYASYKDVAWTDGTNATGTWPINVSGNAATATRATSAATADNGGVTSVNGATGAVTVTQGGPGGIAGIKITSTTSFTVPAGVTSIKVILNLQTSAANDQGHSSYFEQARMHYLAVTPGQVISVVIPARANVSNPGGYWHTITIGTISFGSVAIYAKTINFDYGSLYSISGGGSNASFTTASLGDANFVMVEY